MNIKPVKNKSDYRAALVEIESLMLSELESKKGAPPCLCSFEQ